MKRRRYIAGGIAALIALIAFSAWRAREPRYEGRSLSEWMEDLNVPGSSSGQLLWVDNPRDSRHQRAVIAIRSMGERAVPFLIARIQRRNSFIARNLPNALYERISLLHLKGKDNDDYDKAFQACFVLGPIAVDVAPAIFDYMGETLSSVTPGSVIPNLGPGVMPTLVAEINGHDDFRRVIAVVQLRQLGPIASPAIPDLIIMARSREIYIRQNAGFAIGRTMDDPKVVAPTLIRCLHDDEERVRLETSHGLILAGPRAASQSAMLVPSLLKVAQEETGNARFYAATALAGIDPQAARVVVPVMMKAIRMAESNSYSFSHHGYLGWEALSRIGTIAPEILSEVRTLLVSTNINTRRDATNFMQRLEGKMLPIAMR